MAGKEKSKLRQMIEEYGIKDMNDVQEDKGTVQKTRGRFRRQGDGSYVLTRGYL